MAAAIALLISGDGVRLGWGAIQPWHLVFPYFWFFVLLELLRHRRRVDDAVLFTAGAAMGLFYGGIYAKDLQHGFHPLGIDFLAIPCAMFDWGLLTVVASHISSRLRPRSEEDSFPSLSAIVFLSFGLGAAALVYGIHTIFKFYRADRMIGSTWLLADLFFAWCCWKMAQRTRHLAEEGEEGDRPDWLWAVAAVALWLPGARITARFFTMLEVPDILMYFFVAAWTAGIGYLAWRLWKERGHFDSTLVADSRYVKIAGLWRFVGSVLLILWMGADLNMTRTEGIFSFAIDLPSRALFALAFFTGRLKV